MLRMALHIRFTGIVPSTVTLRSLGFISLGNGYFVREIYHDVCFSPDGFDRDRDRSSRLIALASPSLIL